MPTVATAGPGGQYSTNPKQVTVDYLLKHPRVLSRRFQEDMAKKGFLADAILQGGYDVEGGAIAYNRSEPILPDKEGGRRGYEIVAEGARYPIIGPQQPGEEVVRSQKHGLRMFITDEMRRRNQLPQVDRRLRELKNELVQYVDALFMAKFTTDPTIVANSQAVSAGGTWLASNGLDANGVPKLNILRDIEVAKNYMYAQRKGIEPDTLLVHDNIRLELLTHPAISAALDKGESSQPFFSGQLPKKLANLDVLYTPFIDQNHAYVFQRKAFGGYGDEIPTELTGPDWDGERDLYWFKARRAMVAFIDAPEACRRITGVFS